MIKIITLILFLLTFFTPSNSEVISKIEIKGNKRISNETFSVFGGFKVGDDLSSKDLNKLANDARESNSILLTTEKDYLRIKKDYKKNIKHLKIEIEVHDKDKFINFIKNSI